MATLTLQLPAKVKTLAEARAADAGFEDVAQFVTQLIVSEATGAPEGLTIDSNDDLVTLLASRIDGPFVEVSAEDFRQMRKKLQTRLKTRKARN
jgi:hypothetical protein